MYLMPKVMVGELRLEDQPLRQPKLGGGGGGVREVLLSRPVVKGVTFI